MDLDTFPFATGCISDSDWPTPGEVMDHFIKEVQKASRTGRLPTISTGTEDPWKILRRFGVAAAGQWGRTGVYAASDQGKLLIHWPTLLEWTDPLAFEKLANTSLVSLIGVFMQFNRIIRMFSPHAHELLLRKLSFIGHKVRGVPLPAGYQELTPKEDAILRTWMSARMRDATKYPFLTAFLDSFVATYSSYMPPRPMQDVLPVLRRCGFRDADRENIVGITLLNTKTPAEGRRKVKEVVLKSINHPEFGPTNTNPFTRELIIARDIAISMPAPSKFTGVMRIRPTAENPEYPRVLVINWLRYYNYRRAYTDAYDTILPLRVGKTTQEIARYLQTKYDDKEGFLAPLKRGYDYSALCHKLCIGDELVCADDSEWQYTSLLSLDVFPEVMAAYRRIEVGKIPAVATKKRRLTRSNFYEDTYTDPDTGTPHKFFFYRHGASIYVAPEWPISSDQVVEPSARVYGGEHRIKLKQGVRVINKHTPKYFFSYKAFFANPSGRQNTLKGLNDWVFERVTVSTSMFVFDARGRQGQGIRDIKQREAAAPPRGLQFTADEDAAILQYYRRGMTDEHKNILKARCPLRKFSAISARARELCKNMIAAGELDLDKLPIVRRNAEILELIRKEKARIKKNGKGHTTTME